MGIKDDKPVIKTRSHKIGGDNVVQFPGTAKAEYQDAREGALLHMQKLLRFHFKNIVAAQEKLAKLHVICDETESEYDELLKRYADQVGLENVSYKHMEYSKHAKPVSTPDGIKLVLE